MTITSSRFTPSLMPGAELERLFVARHHILDAVVSRVEEAATSDSRNHTLLVGPRGAGKTHLVALVHHRVRALIAAGARVQLSWLTEDPWTVVSLRRLLTEVARRLEPPIDVPDGADVPTLERLLVERAHASGPVVVLVENLDQVLDQIGDTDQRRLRHLLQTSGALLLVATTTTLDRDLSDQAQPFYGFFSTTRLVPFTVPEAAEMLARIANPTDAAIAAYLETAEARSRLRTIEHLAGGQPRLWSTLGASLTVDGLRDLVTLLMERFDDLTPYYQSQLAQLSTQQRLIVAELASSDRAMHVAEIGARTSQDQRAVAAAVGVLVDRGWLAKVATPVAAPSDRRRSYYELAEPLLRVAFQLKESRGEPLRLVVDFLKGWFDPVDAEAATFAGLEAYANALSDAFAGDGAARVAREISGLPDTKAPALAVRGAVDDALRLLATGDADGLLGLPSPLRRAVEARVLGQVPHDPDLVDIRLEVQRGAVSELFPHHFTSPGKPSVETDTAAWLRRAEDLTSLSRGRWECRVNLADWMALAGRHVEAEHVLRALAAERDDALDLDSVLRLSKTCLLVSSGMMDDHELERAAAVLTLALGLVLMADDMPDHRFQDELTRLIARIERLVGSSRAPG